MASTNNEMKISLKTLFIVILLIAITILGYYTYQLNSINKTNNEQIAELKAKVEKYEQNVANDKESEAYEKNNASNIASSEDISTSNSIESPLELLEKNFSNYTLRTGIWDEFHIENGELFHYKHKIDGIDGAVKCVSPIDKQVGVSIILTETGNLYEFDEGSNDITLVLENVEEIVDPNFEFDLPKFREHFSDFVYLTFNGSFAWLVYENGDMFLDLNDK